MTVMMTINSIDSSTSIREKLNTPATDTPDSSTEAASRIAKILGISTDGESTESASLSGTVQALAAWIETLNELQRTLADLASDFSKTVLAYSNQENKVLEEDRNEIKKLVDKGVSSNSSEMVAANTKLQNDQGTFNTLITTPQNLAEAFQGAVSNLARTTEGDYTNLGTIIQIWRELAGIIR